MSVTITRGTYCRPFSSGFISEAITLEVAAVDRANQVLRIIGKGNKERLVPLPQPVLDDLGHLWRRHRNRR